MQYEMIFFTKAYIYLRSCVRSTEQEGHAILSSSHPLAEDFYLEVLINKRYATLLIINILLICSPREMLDHECGVACR